MALPWLRFFFGGNVTCMDASAINARPEILELAAEVYFNTLSHLTKGNQCVG